MEGPVRATRRITLAVALLVALGTPPLGQTTSCCQAVALPRNGSTAGDLPVAALATASAAATSSVPTTSTKSDDATVVPPATIGSPTSKARPLPRYGSPLPAVPSTLPAGIDEATKRTLQLQEQIELAQQDAVALEQRIAVVNVRILTQQNALDEAQATYDQSQGRFEARLVEMYKSGLSSPFALLLSSRSLADFYTRALMLSRIISEDMAAYREAQVASQEAAYEASILDDMKAQLVLLRATYDSRVAESKQALAEEQALLATLSAQSQALVAARQAASALTRQEWRDSSIAVGTTIPFSTALLEPTGVAYTVAAYQPLRYVPLGDPFSAVCSWYGNEFNGRPTASGQIFNQDDLTCASRTLPFGTRIALERAGRRVIVVVNDRGPFISGRDLDLSRAAARALGFSGVEPVTARYVQPAN